MTLIPVLDLAEEDKGLALKLGAAFRDIGFVALVNHGVPQATIDTLYRSAHAFFDLPPEVKRQVARPRPDQNRGYIAYGEETLARLSGRETPPDHKEIFSIGPFDVPKEPYYQAPAAYPSFAPNLWPTVPPTLQPAMRAYWHAVTALARRVLGISALALGLPADYFAPFTDRHISMLRLICYPPYESAPVDGQLRAGIHTDLNMLTFVHADSDMGGLEVRTRDGTWARPATAGAYIVNVGDILMRWTNDLWVSTPHRVANPPTGWQQRRLSVPFFFQANYDTTVECLPSCRPADRRPKYPPISVGAYRAERFARTAS
ncbi:Isopenicillin N synthase [Enhydrobacter aerosaccus]|uniref:2-oxoglutarate-dependent ethylene/succinate-forming enzyme n=1 Tax=Enhydrobacter aerosaccus TaxID=225324 RepID=A0A1T4JTR8_9HYPH|nr:2-oxoglutarate and iron-dependent oxygenase domain-containing protein [Enhydrobacter aerosaccus]SJZ33576.1 Isopenicillin N synthase [Enhydrobacter aerosaccus]